MELQRRGVVSFLIASKAFEPLVRAQLKQEGVSARVVVVDHPTGGLTPDQLVERIDQAYELLLPMLERGGADDIG